MRFQTDSYLRKLMIMDHIAEVQELYRLYKLKERTWDDVRRELADLCILLLMEVGDDAELYEARIERFREKESKEVEN